jgi:hypothetical protein
VSARVVGNERDRLVGRSGAEDVDLLAVEPGGDVRHVARMHRARQLAHVPPRRRGRHTVVRVVAGLLPDVIGRGTDVGWPREQRHGEQRQMERAPDTSGAVPDAPERDSLHDGLCDVYSMKAPLGDCAVVVVTVVVVTVVVVVPGFRADGTQNSWRLTSDRSFSGPNWFPSQTSCVVKGALAFTL